MFELYRSDKDGKFYFRLKAKNGETILSSQAYADKAGAEKGIASVRANGVDEENFSVKDASDGRKYFNLKAANGQVIATSQMYKSATGAKGGIASVAENAPGAKVNDIT